MINQQILQEIPISNIEVAEIPLKQFSQRKIFSQDAPKKKNNKYQIVLSRHQKKDQSLFTEPSKVKSVRFKEEIEIIDGDILYNHEQTTAQLVQREEEKAPVPSILFPVNKISFPISMDQVRQQIDSDLLLSFQKQTKNIQTPPEIPKRFQSVSRQERDKKANRLNNAFDPWNVNYTFAPVSNRSSSSQTSSAQHNLKSQNNSYQYIQEYSEQYSYRSFYKVSTNSSNNNINSSLTRPKTNQKSPNDNLNNHYPISNTTPIEQLVVQSTKNSYKTNFSFTETASNYKNFAPSISNTPTKIYNQNRLEYVEQDNTDNLPQIYRVAFNSKATTPINSNNCSTKASSQMTNNSIIIHKDEDQQQLGEMLNQLKNHIILKKQQNQIKTKSKSPRRLKRLSIDISSQQVKDNNKTQQKFQTTAYKQSNEQKPNKMIPDQIKNSLFKKIAEQRLQKQNEE
ncbi:hypothetical protein TTHERM_01228980 (macronuclear) [Tetrahymena thermophila SB210]|uniref:Uncharacterized protein n=1 Tax=Tetrahymena thermophila (strain SB210) TaxID=312017 RepID=Q22AG1_TETTS|nr:hypothetical protein TTHERM_01228980 [Tetrahymena thermophila SB210]EAR82281.1 hypothetical protein TTHERM_01228980 [Tetrahymena thermophila SB210]|eukprot:XP_001029944.1 hypothetical protein TTHERM_01228980 [Tetrahymena thermophila SB210]